MQLRTDISDLVAAGRRFLFCRPRGAFNDVCNQLERSLRYAIRYDRVLVVDALRSGMGHQLDELFDIGSIADVELVIGTPEVIAQLDQINDIRPSCARGALNTYRLEWDESCKAYCFAESGQPSMFDFGADHPETLLLYEQAGGGFNAVHFLNRVRLNKDAAEEVAKRLALLPDDYYSVHVRHTDYVSNYEPMLARYRPVYRGKNLLICTDSYEVQQRAPSLLHKSTKVFFTTQVPDNADTPLFEVDYKPRRDMSVDVLCDIIALAQSWSLVFGEVQAKTGRVTYSGLAILAYVLQREPKVLSNGFGHLERTPDTEVFLDRLLAREQQPVSDFWPLMPALLNLRTSVRMRKRYARFVKNDMPLQEFSPRLSVKA